MYSLAVVSARECRRCAWMSFTDPRFCARTVAGAACSIVPISRFVGPHVFALKGGGYGCLFSLAGVDEEGKTDQELDALVRSIEGALRGLPEGSCF